MSNNDDFVAAPPFISCASNYCCPLFTQLQSSAGGAIGTANRAYIVPLSLPHPYLMRKMFVVNAQVSATNSVDIGIYLATDYNAGAKVYTAGSTVQSATGNAMQFFTPAAPILLAPGNYWMAYANSQAGNTNLAFGWTTLLTTPDGQSANMSGAGLFFQDSALPLPATLSPTPWDAPTTKVSVPFFGLVGTNSPL